MEGEKHTMQHPTHAETRPTLVSRRTLLRGALAGTATAALGALLAACGAANPTATSAPAASAGSAATGASSAPNLKGAKIVMLVPSFQALGDSYMEAEAKEFETKTGIHVETSFLPFEKAMDKQITLVAAKSSEVDVFGTHYAQIGRFGEAMVPLAERAARDKVVAQDYVAGSFDALTVNGKLLAIPFTYDLRTLFYRTDLFEQAGIKAPPATWDEFVDVAKKVNRPPDVYGFLEVGKGDPVLREFSDILWENGGDYLEQGLKPSKPIWNNAAGVEALTWMQDLVWKHKVSPPGTASYGWEENSQLFAAGQAAMSKQWGPSGTEDPQQSKIVGKYAVAPIIKNKSARTTAICHARGINISSKNQDAAWEYVKYVTAQEQQLKFSKAQGGRPAHVAALGQARDAAQGVVKQNFEVSLAQSKDGYTWPLFPQFSEVQPILWGEIEKVLSNQKTPKEALDYAATEAEKIFKRANLI
ncbi:MAG TPA: sugar ABC transporter substrate-binding protein [Thermomicrobiales bacterium]|jgi:ABC-type glycerol-3-phosphate transport system substrate-binding protein